MDYYVNGTFYGVAKVEEFGQALQKMVSSVNPRGLFVGDNLITFGKSLGFMRDQRFMSAFSTYASRPNEKQLVWRMHVLCWAAKRGLQLAGDFVECACYRGTSARVVCDYTDFNATGKSYYLYDLFEHSDDMAHHAMPDHGEDLHQRVVDCFSAFPRVLVTKGRVPDVLHDVSPGAISFLHLDLNDATAEIGALEVLFDRMTPGAALVLDDYGWGAYEDQMIAETAFFGERGYSVLELPTGQGLVFK